MNQHLIQEKIKEIMRKWYVVGVVKGMDDAKAVYNDKNPEDMNVEEIEKEMQGEADELVASAKREVIEEVKEIIGTVDEEFLAQPDAENYSGEWAINMDRKRILASLKEKSELSAKSEEK